MAAKSKPRKGTSAGTTKVRTTMKPGKVLEVDERELLDLTRQNLIHSREGDKGWRDGEAEPIDSGIVTDSGDADDDEPETGEGAPE